MSWLSVFVRLANIDAASLRVPPLAVDEKRQRQRPRRAAFAAKCAEGQFPGDRSGDRIDLFIQLRLCVSVYVCLPLRHCRHDDRLQ